MPNKPETGNRYSADRRSVGINWYVLNMENSGRAVCDVLMEDQMPKNLAKGWVINFDIDVLKNVQTALFILRPGEVTWPWGDNFHAQ